MTLHFQSDSFIAGKGFLLEWTAVQDSGPPPTIPPGQTSPSPERFCFLLKPVTVMWLLVDWEPDWFKPLKSEC